MKRGTILLVEDDKNIQRINRRILEREGFMVLCASTLKETQELLREHTPDALVLDIMLPDGNGLCLFVKNPSCHIRSGAVSDGSG